VKPDSQFGAGFFKDRSGQRVNVIPARLASLGCATRHAVVLARPLALAADGYAARKALLFDLLKAGIIGREVSVELVEGVAEFSGNGLSAVHANSLPYLLLVVKG
jgi:hypothetical protein